MEHWLVVKAVLIVRHEQTGKLTSARSVTTARLRIEVGFAP